MASVSMDCVSATATTVAHYAIVCLYSMWKLTNLLLVYNSEVDVSVNNTVISISSNSLLDVNVKFSISIYDIQGILKVEI